MKRRIKMVVRVKDCTKVFHEDLPPGVLASQVVYYVDAPKEGQPGHIRWLSNIVGREKALLADTVEVVSEEL